MDSRVALDEQVGCYQLCYRKMAVYKSAEVSTRITQRLYVIGGSLDFNNEVFEVLVVKGYLKATIDQEGFGLEEHKVRIPCTNRDRKLELIEGLKSYFNDSRIS